MIPEHRDSEGRPSEPMVDFAECQRSAGPDFRLQSVVSGKTGLPDSNPTQNNTDGALVRASCTVSD